MTAICARRWVHGRAECVDEVGREGGGAALFENRCATRPLEVVGDPKPVSSVLFSLSHFGITSLKLQRAAERRVLKGIVTIVRCWRKADASACEVVRSS
jgi:hypothetical protein